MVTGGSRGIGKAIALRIAREGIPVLINYKSNEAAARATVNEIMEAGGKAELLPFDVSDPQQIESAIEQWETAHPSHFSHLPVKAAAVADRQIFSPAVLIVIGPAKAVEQFNNIGNAARIFRTIKFKTCFSCHTGPPKCVE